MSAATPTPDEAFKELMKHSGQLVLAQGFSGSGQSYRRARERQWQAITFQKSQWRTGSDDPICFYVNIGIDFPAFAFKRWVAPLRQLSKFAAG